MADAVESSALQWLYKPSVAAGKFGFGLFNIGTSYVLKTLSRFTGGEFLQELKEFLFSLSPMFAFLIELPFIALPCVCFVALLSVIVK